MSKECSFIRDALQGLALLAMMAGQSPDAAAAQLTQIPEETAMTVLDEVESDDGATEDHRRALRALCLHPSRPVHLRACQDLARSARLEEPDVHSLARLVGSGSGTVGVVAACSLVHLLGRATGLERTWLVSELATSPEESERLAAAWMVQSGLQVVGGYSALEHLSADPSPRVRSAADSALKRYRNRAARRSATRLIDEANRAIIGDERSGREPDREG